MITVQMINGREKWTHSQYETMYSSYKPPRMPGIRKVKEIK